jgi:hypothetical protein
MATLQAQVSTLEATVNTLCLEVMEVRRLLVADRVNLRACGHPATIGGPIADITKIQLPFLATLSKSAFIGYMDATYVLWSKINCKDKRQ